MTVYITMVLDLKQLRAIWIIHYCFIQMTFGFNPKTNIY